MTDQKRLDAIKHLKTLSLAKLRKRQSLIDEQIGIAVRLGLSDTVKTLQDWHMVTSDAIGEKCFKRPFDSRLIRNAS